MKSSGSHSNWQSPTKCRRRNVIDVYVIVREFGAAAKHHQQVAARSIG
jgi:hypothetical protein